MSLTTSNPRPAFFVVVREHGVEHPAIYWDEPPQHRLRNVVYMLRLDTQPDGDKLLEQSVTDLYARYRRLASRGKLPAGMQK